MSNAVQLIVLGQRRNNKDSSLTNYWSGPKAQLLKRGSRRERTGQEERINMSC